MVNGACGVATGWSTFMPQYNLKDVVEYIIAKLNKKQPKLLDPYYNGYIGKISVRCSGESEILVTEGKYVYANESL